MKLERSDIKFPLWRKKVDASLFHKAHTPIPNWCVKAWHIEDIFGRNTSKRVPTAEVKISFRKEQYSAHVTYSFSKDTNYQIYFPKDFVEQLKEIFLMSYMRSLEQRLRKGNNKYDDIDIEEEIPFWEFLDIEFDQKSKIFNCKAHYNQKPIFPELFKQFINSHILKEVENKLLEKGDFKFVKDNWRPRSELSRYLAKNNIIYYLIDTQKELLYIGESEHTKRLSMARNEIPDWDYFRVDFLPEWLSRSQRLELERLLIRSFASVLPNSKNIYSLSISNYRLINKKIDS